MSQKPATPKGTRDFGPLQSAKRNYIIEILKKHFRRYGFQQLETPAMENLSTLTGKYGDEGDQLLFKVLNSGDFMSKVPQNTAPESKKLLPLIAEKGLRYDLTVPFARYVVTHQHEIAYPFKRFQVQPVWRADRPQKSRYREFYQCDADIIGTKSVWNEVELTLLIQDAFQDLALQDFIIHVNHRSILNALAAYCGLTGSEMAFCVELDKLDKIGHEKVVENIVNMGGVKQKVGEVMNFLTEESTAQEQMTLLKARFQIDEKELEKFFNLLAETSRDQKVKLDFSLARGLTYYTGMVFEVKPTSVSMGSICGGGRYDDLTGVFGLKDVSGVGISFGLDRIYDVMEELNLFPAETSESVDVFIVHFDEDCFLHGISLVNALRGKGIHTDIYPECVKIKKQFNHADKINARHTLVIGQEEIENKRYKLKDMSSGEQKSVSLDEIIAQLKTR